MSRRLFIGLEIPELDCGAALASVAEPLAGVRWLTDGMLHLTLAFIGEVADSARGPLENALAAIRVPPFLLRIEGVGTFGKPRPTVIWAGVGSGHPHLFALHKAVHDALFAAGLNPELRAFHPHITLARVRDASAESLRPFLRKHADSRFCRAEFRSFVLFSSQLQPEGACHTVEARWDLVAK
jgi:RNA 2',3'-cyclic 3'-phosphodiesterase